MNNMEMNGYHTRNMTTISRNGEEHGYNTNTVDMMNSMNQSYMMNGGVGGAGQGAGAGEAGGATLNNMHQNEYLTDREKYTADILSQMKMEQAMNSYNNTASMQNGTMQDPNELTSMRGMNISMDPSGYESYRNLMNYNNTQNTVKTNQIPLQMGDMNNGEPIYYNEQTGEVYPEEYLENLPTTIDPATTIGYGNAFKMQNGNFTQRMADNYASMQYPMPVFENMNNPQMFMQQQASLTPKQTRNIPLLNASQMQAPRMQQMTPSMQQMTPSMQQQMTPSMQQMTPSMQLQIPPTTSLRKIPTANKRKNKPKKFFPCC